MGSRPPACPVLARRRLGRPGNERAAVCAADSVLWRLAAAEPELHELRATGRDCWQVRARAAADVRQMNVGKLIVHYVACVVVCKEHDVATHSC